MKYIYLLFIAIFTFVAANAQVIKRPLAASYPGPGAYSKNFSDIFSATSNQASLAQLKTAAGGVYGERRFLLEELNSYTAVVAIPTSSGVFGLQSDYFGSAAFNESQLGVSYARKITDYIDVGTKFNYYAVRIAGYQNVASVNFEAGAIVHVTGNLHAGIHVYNPAGSRLGKYEDQKLASVYRMGLGYEISEMLFVSTELVKQQSEQISVNAGLQYNLQKNIFIRTGISTLTNNSYAAVAVQLSFARIDVNSSYHPQLGFTPGLLLLFNLKKEDKD